MVPSGVSSVRVFIVGGGSSGCSDCGACGGGGGYVACGTFDVNGISSVPVVVGIGAIASNNYRVNFILATKSLSQKSTCTLTYFNAFSQPSGNMSSFGDFIDASGAIGANIPNLTSDGGSGGGSNFGSVCLNLYEA